MTESTALKGEGVHKAREVIGPIAKPKARHTTGITRKGFANQLRKRGTEEELSGDSGISTGL